MSTGSEDRLINYVNLTMGQVNDLSSDLYEALIDQKSDDVVATIDKLDKLLKDIKKSYR